MTDEHPLSPPHSILSRRRFARGVGAGVCFLAGSHLLPGWARTAAGLTRATAPGADVELDLRIGRTTQHFDDRAGEAVTINGTVPGPLVRLQEGAEATLRVINELDEPTSIHWHGLLVPNEMDGVPGVNFAGIPAGETFVYRFPVRQNGTYWYHSHSGLQEQLGHYGPLVIDPAEPDPVAYDREHVIVLSDWTFENPYRLLAKLKKQANYYNRQRRTLANLPEEAERFGGVGAALADRRAWAAMRMDSTDLADVTGATYTYLLNGLAPDDNWTALYRPGERVRLRFVNAAAASILDVRIPGLDMTVVQCDGQNVEPVTVHEFRLGPAETVDVVVEPRENLPYTIFAESMDRSGYARGTLATREGERADIPSLRPRALRTMTDMGMDHGSMDHAGTDHGAMASPTRDHAAMGHGTMDSTPPPQQQDAHAGHAMASAPAPGDAPPPMSAHGPDGHGPGNAGVPDMVGSRLDEAGTGLGNDGWRVLRYSDLRALDSLYPYRTPDREIELHATGNMERYMWSFDGEKFSEVDGPIELHHGERVRIHFVNDTMMEHPLHLHGMWMHVVNGHGDFNARKHTVTVKPAERFTVDVEADAPGPWAFHCHLLYHMEAGMFRVVRVSEPTDEGGRAHEHHHDEAEASPQGGLR